jgi:hypothetical protein
MNLDTGFFSTETNTKYGFPGEKDRGGGAIFSGFGGSTRLLLHRTLVGG